VTRRDRPRTPLEVRLAEQRRRWRAERRARRRVRWRHWWSDIVPMAVMGLLGGAAFLAFTIAGVFGVMAAMGFDDSRYIPIGVIVGLVIGVPVIVLVVRFTRGGGGGPGGWSGGGDAFDSSEY
jgi:hypothetical protein